MFLKHKKRKKWALKGSIDAQIRQKLGLTQAQLANIFSVSRPYLAMVESGKRSLPSNSGITFLDMFRQFDELETGKQLSYRSLETRLFINDAYKRVLPQMKLMEQECRLKIKMLKRDLALLKERARDTEHAIIVFTTLINKIQESEEPGKEKREKQLEGLALSKAQAYNNFLTCWEPEQAKLHGKIEALAGEARSLRRYRVKVMKEQGVKG